LEKTRQGRVQWQGGLGVFSCAVGSEKNDLVRFTLSTTATRDINYDERFLVMEDANENELFRVASNDLPTSAEEEEISRMVNELYELARRQALRVDEKLELASTLLDRA
jgi:uncharacterized protein (UPF0548 family)